MSPGLSRSFILHWGIFAIALVFFAPAAAAPAGPIVSISPQTGNITVFDPTTLQPIPQFPATDGGSGMLNTILWAVFSILVGTSLGIVGMRAGRITMGVAVGLVCAVLGKCRGCMRARMLIKPSGVQCGPRS